MATQSGRVGSIRVYNIARRVKRRVVQAIYLLFLTGAAELPRGPRLSITDPASLAQLQSEHVMLGI